MAKQKSAYVDGFVLVVPEKNLSAYKKMAQKAGKIWRKYGALDYKECVGDDLKTKWGVPFPKLVRLKRDEIVVFSYVTYRSRAHRDRVNALVMKDPFMNDAAYKDKPMPFDVKRMVYGGFKVLVDG
ncbi:RNA signal recognition particle [Candidatus Falkowbacteria bacterium RIFOXYB2_FULL_47_14]|uniref:RNA signal recognition particle n=1 Tax=Candidatus Falkowbacteria bacterium RIFOXYA2_FULL_47_19 TaxID=1797994 RepID=A0A1F5SGU9_9BACT|nr:MAG: RNA signal recognition particle [Candidatus Falkowbacteria bacterium RIFOXYA2_FULL_47_19]OGF35531.1 MAG: RNA signal recognition particle [Candidatus Falkowbacteria bacterium RIFOXYC2_FULL_46_15]OGF43560.1 MAG: RNA signal recognition particle [Candidatus Falkowbacteria bacterium RIFOXYB2_FULL_47_14]